MVIYGEIFLIMLKQNAFLFPREHLKFLNTYFNDLNS